MYIVDSLGNCERIFTTDVLHPVFANRPNLAALVKRRLIHHHLIGLSGISKRSSARLLQI